MEAMDCVKLDIYRLKNSLDDKLVLLTLIRNKIIKYRPDIVTDLNEMIDEFQESLRNTYDIINRQFLNNFFPFIEVINPLVMNPSENGIYEFVSGYSPWKFLLKNDDDDEFENIKSTILNELSINGLSKCKSAPENGDVVLASDKGNIYRAFILGTATKMCYKIMNIDTGEISTVAIGSLNNLPSSLAVFPPQVSYCTLLKDSFYEKYWNDSFSKKFIAIMKTMKFSIKIIEQISINPPCFEVHLTGFRNGNEIDISDWFFKIFFQNMELYGSNFELFDKYVYDPFEAESDRDEQFLDSQQLSNIEESHDDSNNDDLAAHVDDGSYESDILFIRNVFENFSKRFQNEENTSASQIETTMNSSTKQEIDSDNDNDDYEKNIAFLTAIFSENCKDLMETCSCQQSSSAIGQDLPDLGDECESNIALLEAEDGNTSKGEVKISRYQMKELLVQSSPDIKDKNLSNLGEQCERNVTLLEPDIVKEYNDEEKRCRLQSSNIEGKGPHLEHNIDEEFEDEKKICSFHIREPKIQASLEIEVEENMPELDEFESNIALLEADIGEEYKDEVKTCKFQLKKGHCWKEYCPREHVNPGPGYIGSVFTYAYFDFEYPLPEEKETIFVNPKVIVSGHIFYGHLIDYTIWSQPDLKLLETRMNSKEEYQCFERFDLLPTIGELCLAYGKLNRWYRARIIEVDEIEVQVLSVDYGYGEKVLLNNIRKIKCEYLFLPPQAIRFVLQGITPVEDKKSEAMKYMRDVALNQIFKATVKESYQQDSCIEISLICPNGHLIEASLITKGYYRTIESYSHSTVSEQQQIVFYK